MKKRTTCDYLLKTNKKDIAELLTKYDYKFMYMEGPFYVFADTGKDLPMTFESYGILYSNLLCL